MNESTAPCWFERVMAVGFPSWEDRRASRWSEHLDNISVAPKGSEKMEFGGIVALTYFVGIFVSFLPYHWRAGLDKHWREFLLANIPWFLMLFGKQIAWPAVLVYWAVKGFPKSTWVAIRNYKGHEVRKMMRRDQAVAEGLVSA